MNFCFVKQLFRIQIKKGGKVLLWNMVKSRMEACYSELILKRDFFLVKSQSDNFKIVSQDFFMNWLSKISPKSFKKRQNIQLTVSGIPMTLPATVAHQTIKYE